MNEWLMIICMGAAGILFAAGGTGFKWLRRFVMPVILGVCCLIGGIIWWKCLAMTVTMIASMHLGYGSKYPYWFKFLVGCSFVLPTLFFGLNLWQILTPVIFIGMFWLSNFPPLSNQFVWKICEFVTGTLIGITVGWFLK